MDKSCQYSGDSTITSSSSSSIHGNNNNNNNNNNNSSSSNDNRDQYLKHLNKLSHKISKPIIPKKPAFGQTLNIDHQLQQQQQQQAPQHQSQQQNLQNQQQQQSLQAQQQQQQQHQPPVYNINKSDFRDVVQKLTGSPAHERISSAPPPIHPPKPPSSRLQRIRPPPLAHVSNRPPPSLNSTIPPQQPPVPLDAPLNPIPIANSFLQRPPAPLSPLPPFPAVHTAAESPVSAYLRYLQNSMSTVDPNKQFSGFSPLTPLVSPRWNSLAASQQQQQNNQQELAAPPQQAMIPPSQPPFQLPASPTLPFGCLNSPRSPYPLLSPSLLLSPSSFPLSPTLPVPSPTWRGL